jgi:hypothetical protein
MTDPKLYWLATVIRNGNPAGRWASLWTCEEIEGDDSISEISLTGLTETRGKFYAY